MPKPDDYDPFMSHMDIRGHVTMLKPKPMISTPHASCTSRVRPATLTGTLGSFGNARNQLIRQSKFPDYYDPDLDKLTGWDSDRVWQNDHKHADAVCNEFFGVPGSGGLSQWTKTAKVATVRRFLEKFLKATETNWTGWRITASVNRSNGQTIYHLALFAKHPDSKAKVYSGNERSPNIVFSSPY